jgi:histidinol-phosphate/aromatic aminotransferase/cobyric acid decarboxylase-like protein
MNTISISRRKFAEFIMRGRRRSLGRHIIAADPTFEAILECSQANGAEAVKVPLTSDFSHDLPKMAAAASASTGSAF